MISEGMIDHDMASTEMWNAQEALQKAKYAKEREEQEAAYNQEMFKLQQEMEKQKAAMEEEMKRREEEMMKRIQEMQSGSQQDKDNLAKENETRLNEQENKMKKMSDEIDSTKNDQIERLKKMEEIRKRKFGEKLDLERKITEFMPKVSEANLISERLKRHCTMHLKMSSNAWEFDTSDELEELENKKVELFIEAFNIETQSIMTWGLIEFEERLYVLRGDLDKLENSGKIPEHKNEDDPLWDPPAHSFIGQAKVQLKHLAYLIDNTTTLNLIGPGDSGEPGQINVNLYPLTKDGEIDDDNFIAESNKLLNQTYKFMVQIEKVEHVPAKLANQVYVGFEFFDTEKLKSGNLTEIKKYETKKSESYDRNPTFNTEFNFEIKSVNAEFLK